jgi:hypothetical protein
MDIEDAIVASDFIECDKVLGYYDTFGYIEMIIKQPFKSFPIKERFDVAKNRREHRIVRLILSACRMVSLSTISIPSRSVGTGVKKLFPSRLFSNVT